MIQYPKPGEIIIEVPNQTPRELVAFHHVGQRLFEGALIRGVVVERDGRRGIDWDLDDTSAVSMDDTTVVAGIERILLRADGVEQAAGELSERLRRHPDPTQPVRIPAELAVRIGTTANRDFIPYSEAVALPHRDAMLRLSAWVRGAIARGHLVMQAGHLKVFGWGVLAREFLDAPAPQRPRTGSVTLERLPDEEQPDRVVQALQWHTRGGATKVELIRVDGVEAIVDDTAVPLTGATAEGVWRFPSGSLVAGSRYQARATGPWGLVYSEIVGIPPLAEAP